MNQDLTRCDGCGGMEPDYKLSPKDTHRRLTFWAAKVFVRVWANKVFPAFVGPDTAINSPPQKPSVNLSKPGIREKNWTLFFGRLSISLRISVEDTTLSGPEYSDRSSLSIQVWVEFIYFHLVFPTSAIEPGSREGYPFALFFLPIYCVSTNGNGGEYLIKNFL